MKRFEGTACFLIVATIVLMPLVAQAKLYLGSGTDGGSGCALIKVINDNDSGPGSLRQAIVDANGSSGPDEIVFDGVTGVINLLNPLTEVTEELTITGPGADQLTIDANRTGSVLEIDSPGNDQKLTVSGLTLREGDASAGDGGGIVVSGGDSLAVRRCVIVDNHAQYGGGGISFDGAHLEVTDSAILGNEADEGAGLDLNKLPEVSSITNTTISGNLASGEGGGLVFLNVGTLNLINVTIAGNATGVRGGGILTDLSDPSTVVNIHNTLLAGNTDADDGVDPDCYGDIHSLGFNLIQTVSTNCSVLDIDTGNIMGEDPLLGALADNGGPTSTHALLAGSPAIDNGDNSSCPSADQRGQPRNDGECDIGAFEASSTSGGTTGGTTGSTTGGTTGGDSGGGCHLIR